MFKDGFHNKVDIFYYKHDKSRGMRNNSYFSNDIESTIKDIPCRIREDLTSDKIKIFFDYDINIKKGDGIYNSLNNAMYEVTEVKNVLGISEKHHITCYAKKAYEKAGVLYGRQI